MNSGRLAVFGILLWGAVAPAGGTPEHLLSDEALLRDWRRDVYVVTVKAVDDKGSTNGNPPRVVLVVEEALRGEAKAGAELKAVWHPFPHDIDTTGRDKELAAWKARPLAGQKVGDKLIVLEYLPPAKDPFSVSPRCRIPATKEKRDGVAALMGDWKRLREQPEEKGPPK
jgi:hypothetical protein